MAGLNEEEDIKEQMARKRVKKEMYYDFLKDFREFIVEYVRESVNELCISELPVKGEIKLFDGHNFGKVKLKNQGPLPCYISTTGRGGYRLEPGESTPEFFVNSKVVATTVSGSTSLGFVRT